jgi:hypothetical protein
MSLLILYTEDMEQRLCTWCKPRISDHRRLLRELIYFFFLQSLLHVILKEPSRRYPRLLARIRASGVRTLRMCSLCAHCFPSDHLDKTLLLCTPYTSVFQFSSLLCRVASLTSLGSMRYWSEITTPSYGASITGAYHCKHCNSLLKEDIREEDLYTCKSWARHLGGRASLLS